MQTLLAVVFVFVILVFFHELGHFLFAKRAGILAREFAIGFGPKIVSFKKGETRYTLRLFPLGGFVRMAGEDPEIVNVQPGHTIALALNKNNQAELLYLDRVEARKNVVVGTVKSIDLEKELTVVLEADGIVQSYQVDPQAQMIYENKEIQIAPWNRQFGSKTIGQRAMTIFAGPLMNFLLTLVLFISVAFAVGVPDKVVLGKLEPNLPAVKAGLKTDDSVLSINDIPMQGNAQKLVQIIQQSQGQPMVWSIERNGQPKQIELRAVKEGERWKIGAVIGNSMKAASVLSATSYGFNETIFMGKQILLGFKQLVTGHVNMKDLAGPVGIMDITGQAAAHGFPSLLRWAAILSLYLGIFNLMPIPALDGSRLLFIGFEAVRGRPLDPQKESMVHFVGFAFLMLLMIVVTYNDILRLFD